MRKIFFVIGLVLFMWAGMARQASAVLVINEFLADPALGLAGDANRDGVRHVFDDEFVELYNPGLDAVDISEWKMEDSTALRHLFVAGTMLLPYERLVIFGGGVLGSFPYAAVAASSESLSLNNTSDEIRLVNHLGETVDFVAFGTEANLDQSLTRFPDGNGDFSLHTSISSQGLLYSPGTDTEGNLTYPPPPQEPDNPGPIPDSSEPAVPEPATWVLLLGGLSGLMQKRKRFLMRRAA